MADSIRLLIDGSAASGAGAGWTRVCELGRELPMRAPQHELAFVVRPRLRAQMEEIVAGSAAVISPSPRLGPAPTRVAWQLTRLPERARAFAPDVVLSLFNILAPRWPSPRPRLAVMVSNLAPFSREIRRTFRLRARPRDVLLHRLTRAALGSADLVVFQSRFSRATVTADCAVGRHVVIPHIPPTIDLPPPAPAWSDGAPYVAVVANRYPYKRIETVVEALARIEPDARPRLALVGTRADPRYAGRLDRLVDALGLGHEIVDLGPLPHEDALALMAGAAACIACSRFENLSRIPSEAMALGTPLIASDIPSHREAAGSAALYYRDGDAAALATTMQGVLGDLSTRKRLIAAGNVRTEQARRADPVGALLAALEELSAASRPSSREQPRSPRSQHAPLHSCSNRPLRGVRSRPSPRA